MFEISLAKSLRDPRGFHSLLRNSTCTGLKQDMEDLSNTKKTYSSRGEGSLSHKNDYSKRENHTPTKTKQVLKQALIRRGCNRWSLGQQENTGVRDGYRGVYGDEAEVSKYSLSLKPPFTCHQGTFQHQRQEEKQHQSSSTAAALSTMSQRQLHFPCKCISDILDGGASTCRIPPAMIVELERNGQPVGDLPGDDDDYYSCLHIADRLEAWCERCLDARCDRTVKYRATAVIDIILEDDDSEGKENEKGRAKTNPPAQTAVPSAPIASGSNTTSSAPASSPSVVMPPPPSSRLRGPIRSLRERFNVSPPRSVAAPRTPTPTTTTAPAAVATPNNSSNNTAAAANGVQTPSPGRRVSERIRALHESLTSRARNPESSPASSSSASPAGQSAPSSFSRRTTGSSAGNGQAN
ncbi:hypothetical protein V8F20_003245 [Naviculisporaceae sp. PSN 640]